MDTQQPLSLKELQARYPYQFKDPELGVSMAKGWVVVFAQLCADVDHVLGQDKRGFHWSQVPAGAEDVPRAPPRRQDCCLRPAARAVGI